MFPNGKNISWLYNIGFGGKPFDDPINDLLNLKHIGSVKEF